MTRLRNIAGDWRDWRIWIEADSTLYGIRDEEIRRRRRRRRILKY